MWFTTWNLPSKDSLVPFKTCPVGWTFSRATIQQCLAQKKNAECLAKDQQSKFNASVLLCFALPTCWSCWLSYFSQQIEHWMGFPSSYWSSGRPLWQSETGHRWAHQHPDKRCESKSFEKKRCGFSGYFRTFLFFLKFLAWMVSPTRKVMSYEWCFFQKLHEPVETDTTKTLKNTHFLWGGTKWSKSWESHRTSMNLICRWQKWVNRRPQFWWFDVVQDILA